VSLFLANCSSSRPASGGGGDEVAAFLSATGISDETIEAALEALVASMKADSIWTKFSAVYPFVGGTADTHKYNLKNTATFQVTWNGTVTHNANGITSNGSTGYGNTGFNHSTHGADDDEHLSLYSRSNFSNSASDMGGGDSYLIPRNTTFRARSQSTLVGTTAVADSLGYFSVNRTDSAGFRLRHNATNTDITQDSDSSRLNQSLFLCCRNSSGTPTDISGRNLAWAAIGLGLTEAEDGDLRTHIQTFQTALSRNV
jgi:hypothetical protein